MAASYKLLHLRLPTAAQVVGKRQLRCSCCRDREGETEAGTGVGAGEQPSLAAALDISCCLRAETGNAALCSRHNLCVYPLPYTRPCSTPLPCLLSTQMSALMSYMLCMCVCVCACLLHMNENCNVVVAAAPSVRVCVFVCVVSEKFSQQTCLHATSASQPPCSPLPYSASVSTCCQFCWSRF